MLLHDITGLSSSKWSRAASMRLCQILRWSYMHVCDLCPDAGSAVCLCGGRAEMHSRGPLGARPTVTGFLLASHWSYSLSSNVRPREQMAEEELHSNFCCPCLEQGSCWETLWELGRDRETPGGQGARCTVNTDMNTLPRGDRTRDRCFALKRRKLLLWQCLSVRTPDSKHHPKKIPGGWDLGWEVARRGLEGHSCTPAVSFQELTHPILITSFLRIRRL